jgi:hypothetical protein
VVAHLGQRSASIKQLVERPDPISIFQQLTHEDAADISGAPKDGHPLGNVVLSVTLTRLIRSQVGELCGEIQRNGLIVTVDDRYPSWLTCLEGWAGKHGVDVSWGGRFAKSDRVADHVIPDQVRQLRSREKSTADVPVGDDAMQRPRRVHGQGQPGVCPVDDNDGVGEGLLERDGAGANIHGASAAENLTPGMMSDEGASDQRTAAG